VVKETSTTKGGGNDGLAGLKWVKENALQKWGNSRIKRKRKARKESVMGVKIQKNECPGRRTPSNLYGGKTTRVRGGQKAYCDPRKLLRGECLLEVFVHRRRQGLGKKTTQLSEDQLCKVLNKKHEGSGS